MCDVRRLYKPRGRQKQVHLVIVENLRESYGCVIDTMYSIPPRLTLGSTQEQAHLSRRRHALFAY